jgi:glycine cleavage system H protein
MEFPEHLRYTKDHEWVAQDGDQATVGVTDYAQDSLGDVVYVGLPEVGREVSAGETIAEVESTKSVSDIFAPIGGTITDVNQELADHPEYINSDPYGKGWICKIAPSSSGDSLLDANAYRRLVDQA